MLRDHARFRLPALALRDGSALIGLQRLGCSCGLARRGPSLAGQFLQSGSDQGEQDVTICFYSSDDTDEGAT